LVVLVEALNQRQVSLGLESYRGDYLPPTGTPGGVEGFVGNHENLVDRIPGACGFFWIHPLSIRRDLEVVKAFGKRLDAPPVILVGLGQAGAKALGGRWRSRDCDYISE
jgi:hypothetical protein